MKVATSRLKDATSKVIKGASFNNLIPLTSMLGIKLSGGELRLLTTDMSNTIAVTVDKVAGDDMDITIDADKFSKLIAKITSNEISLEVKDDVLNIKANGTYKLPLIADEEGLVSFPDIQMIEGEESEVLLSSILSVYNINRQALAQTMERPELVGYYVGEDMVVSTDSDVITFNKIRMLDGEPILLPSPVEDLLTLFDDEKISYIRNGNDLLFKTDNIMVSGTTLEGLDDYPIEPISEYLEEAFPSNCKVPKSVLLDILDRLSLFIEPYDKNGAYFTFGRKGITISSKKDSSTETVNYIESKDYSSFVCCVDIPLFRQQLDANPEDTIRLYYGNENALKIENGNIVQIVALLEDEELDNE